MNPNCRLCHSTSTSLVFYSTNTHGHHYLSPETYSVFLCNNCQSYFLDNIESSKKYYSDYYIENYYPKSSFIDFLISPFLILPKIILINLFFRNYSSVTSLDIGCGQGHFLHHLPSKYKKTGIDINSSNIYPEITFIKSDFISYKFNNSYNLISLFHVLEHLPDPNKVIKKIYNLLYPKGLVIISVPNSKSLAFKIGKSDYFHLDSPRHLFIPNPKAIIKILKDCGFVNIRQHHPLFDYPLDLFWSVRNSKFKFLIYPLYPIFKLIDRPSIIITAVKP